MLPKIKQSHFRRKNALISHGQRPGVRKGEGRDQPETAICQQGLFGNLLD
ncbi:hypothetical protein SB48_HM08orf03587 [Heyndrickxia coagulans]|uniref:Uncharacterized protein n=1 Tax=Heyndrickxia coagulans TaxID=1398 RepID=A0AAN0T503_HEYCO|nr:hypothetical protein SB48_HM08orf03587 [Heyndrickxia coagulans]